MSTVTSTDPKRTTLVQTDEPEHRTLKRILRSKGRSK